MKYLYVIFLILTASCSFGQVPPQGFNYSSVIRGNNNQAIPNTYVSVRISILQHNPNGTIVYQEVHSDTTNQFGVLNLTIGGGSPTIGNFTGISWGAGNHYMQTELDDQGGTNFEVMGVSQFLSVPYALYSGYSNGSLDNDTSALNEIQTLSYSNDTLYLTDGGQVHINNPTNTSDLNNDSGFITNSDDADADPTNEMQVLSVSNDTIFLSNGGFVKLPPSYSGTNTDNQTISYQNDTLSISNGNSIPVPALSNDQTVGHKIASSNVGLSNTNDGWMPVPYNGNYDTLQLSITVNSPNDIFMIYAGYTMEYLGSSASSKSSIRVYGVFTYPLRDVIFDAEHHSNGGMITSCAGSVVVTDLSPGTYTVRVMNFIDSSSPPGTRYYQGSRHLLVRKL